jgi:hypothetical protein
MADGTEPTGQIWLIFAASALQRAGGIAPADQASAAAALADAMVVEFKNRFSWFVEPKFGSKWAATDAVESARAAIAASAQVVR